MFLSFRFGVELANCWVRADVLVILTTIGAFGFLHNLPGTKDCWQVGGFVTKNHNFGVLVGPKTSFGGEKPIYSQWKQTMNTKYRLDRLQFLTPPTFQPSLAFFSQITVAVPFFLAPFSLASALDALLGTSCLTLASFLHPRQLFRWSRGPHVSITFGVLGLWSWCRFLGWSFSSKSRSSSSWRLPCAFPRPRHRPRPRLLGRFRGFERFGVTFGFSETEGSSSSDWACTFASDFCGPRSPEEPLARGGEGRGLKTSLSVSGDVGFVEARCFSLDFWFADCASNLSRIRFAMARAEFGEQASYVAPVKPPLHWQSAHERIFWTWCQRKMRFYWVQ